MAWLVTVGWAGDVDVKTGDLGGQTIGNNAVQESEPP